MRTVQPAFLTEYLAERNLSIRLSVVDGGKVYAELSEIGEKGERSKKLRLGSRQTRSCGFACRGQHCTAGCGYTLRFSWIQAYFTSVPARN